MDGSGLCLRTCSCPTTISDPARPERTSLTGFRTRKAAFDGERGAVLAMALRDVADSQGSDCCASVVPGAVTGIVPCRAVCNSYRRLPNDISTLGNFGSGGRGRRPYPKSLKTFSLSGAIPVRLHRETSTVPYPVPRCKRPHAGGTFAGHDVGPLTVGADVRGSRDPAPASPIPRRASVSRSHAIPVSAKKAATAPSMRPPSEQGGSSSCRQEARFPCRLRAISPRHPSRRRLHVDKAPATRRAFSWRPAGAQP